jgi:ABC-2 type transport system permease protein
VLGKAISAGVRALSQVVIVYAISWAIGVHINWNPVSLLTVIFVVLFGAAFFSTFSLVIACLVKTRERFMGIGQVLTMPLFFASNAIYPIALMPRWLQIIARGNPLTYEVDALRGAMLVHGASQYGLLADAGVLFAATCVLVLLAGKLYPRVVT